MFNPAISKLTAPPVSVVQDWRASYEGAKGPLIDMSQAVPGYAAHPAMITALEAAAADRTAPDMDGSRTGIYAAYGTHLGDIYGAVIAPSEIHITSGCNQAFVAAVLAVAGQGMMKSLMTRPCYFNHESTLGMLGIGIGYVDCEASNGMLPRLEDIAAAIGLYRAPSPSFRRTTPAARSTRQPSLRRSSPCAVIAASG